MKKALPIIILVVAVVVVVFIAAGIVNKGEKDRRLVIAVVLRPAGGLFSELFCRGAGTACEGTGYRIYRMEAGGTSGPESSERLGRDLIGLAACGVVLVQPDDRTIAALGEALAREAMPCVIVGTRLDAYREACREFCCVGPDEYVSGLRVARTLAESLGRKGRIVVLRYSGDSASIAKRENGFIHTIRNDFPEIEIVDTRYAMDSPGALAAAKELLNANVDIDGLFVSSDSISPAVLKALGDSQTHERMKIAAFGAHEQLIDALGAGSLDALAVRDCCTMARVAVGAVRDSLEGRPVEHHIDVKDLILTRESLNDPEIRRRMGMMAQ